MDIKQIMLIALLLSSTKALLLRNQYWVTEIWTRTRICVNYVYYYWRHIYYFGRLRHVKLMWH